MVFKKSLKGLLAGIILGAGALIPRESFAQAQPDLIDVTNSFSGAMGPQTIKLAHYGSSSSDNYESPFDVDWVNSPQLWGPKIVTLVQGHQLTSDFRKTNSVSSFEADLRAYTDGTDITSSNALGIKVYSNGVYKFFSPLRHYLGEYSVISNFTVGGQGFFDKKNLREIISSSSPAYLWQGPQLNILSSQTNSQGEVTYGKFILSCDWNQLVSSHSGNGSNSFEGNTIMNYDSQTNVTLNADTGNYVDYYVLTRTDTTGTVSVVTNDFPGTDVTSTNIALNGIMGSNSIYAVYAQNAPSTFSVNIENGEKYGLSPTNFTGVVNGGSVTTTASSVYSTNSPGIRTKMTGLERKTQ
ncbi:Uncharacterised protein [uncultured archaeon]|nr:Uncharacterised protein [uncultured archaeon]